MAITLTNAAADRVRRFIEKEGKTALRIGVRKTGCSGWAYTMELTDGAQGEDAVFQDGDIQIVVAPRALSLIDGTQLDYIRDGLNHSFRFINPNVTGECGCGESFAINPAA